MTSQLYLKELRKIFKIILSKKYFRLLSKLHNILRQPWYLNDLNYKKSRFLFPFQKSFPLLIVIYIKLRKFFYKGKKKYCPCCEGYFRKFLPVGIEIRSSGQCPLCGSLKRHRLIFLFLKYKTDFFSNTLKVLHFAPREILQMKFKNMPNLDYISTDLYSSFVMIKMDITDIKFNDNSFDVIICNRVLEHVNNDKTAMKELYRILKPNGWAIIQVPIDYSLEKTFEDPNIVNPEERKRLFGQEDHVRLYGRDYIHRLKEAGFTVIIKNFTDELSEELINKFELDKNEKIYYCTK